MPEPDWNAQIIEEFRANGGRVGGPFAGADLLLLTTAGARTGRPRTSPVTYARDGRRLLVFASNAGAGTNPDWYHNLLADPQATIEIGEPDGTVGIHSALAVPLDGDERDHAYAAQAARVPAFADYEAKTTRTIPVVALQVLELGADPGRTAAVGATLRGHHAELRRAMRVARAELDGDAPAQAQAQRCRRLCDDLRLHHTREDGAFTAFEAGYPELREPIGRLRADHHDLDGALTGLAELAARLGGPDADADADADAGDADVRLAMRVALDRLIEDLEVHFASEERQLFPVVADTSPAHPHPRSAVK